MKICYCSFLLLVGGKEVGHLANVEQVVDVLEKGLVLDLRVGEEEHAVLVGLGRLAQDALQVLVPLVDRVALADLDHKQVVLGQVRGELGERLAAGAADVDEQGVAARLLEDARDAHDARDARHVLDGKSCQI